MKSIITIILCILTVSMHGKPNVIFYKEYAAKGFALYADNHEVCPVYVKIDFTIRNLEVADMNKTYFVIPPKSLKYKLTNLVVLDKLEDFSFTYSARVNFGDPNHTSFKGEFKCHLPYGKGKSYWIGQGYGGTFSHTNQFAVDFNMPLGTEIYSARGGIIVDVVQENDKSCAVEECSKYNNYILIYHSDGTFAEYAHIKKNGAVVKIEDTVAMGQLIGYSGNVGWTYAPNLHFEVFLPRLNFRKTLKTNFLLGDGSNYGVLFPDQKYLRAY